MNNVIPEEEDVTSEGKVSFEEYQALLVDDRSDESLILDLSIIEHGEGKFDWVLKPDPKKVDIPISALESENAMGFANSFCRGRRQSRFRRRFRNDPTIPVLVSEGDSWFQFPIVIKEVIDQLSDDYLVWSVGAAGDTAANMIFGPDKKFKTEYMRALRRQKDHVKAFLFSAAGNDIIGEDPETKTSALFDILNEFNGHLDDVQGHINSTVFEQRLATLRRGYERVIHNVRTEPGLENLPILIHGYDYVFPFPFGDDDPRNPFYAENDGWLGKPLKEKDIPTSLGREIIRELIDGLYTMLEDVAGSSNDSNVWVVDCRGALPELTDWADEIHGTSDGFSRVAERFKVILRNNGIH